MTGPRWATIAEVADQLGVHRDTIRRMIRRGDLEAKRFGPRLIRVDIRALDASGTPILPAGQGNVGDRRS